MDDFYDSGGDDYGDGEDDYGGGMGELGEDDYGGCMGEDDYGGMGELGEDLDSDEGEEDYLEEEKKDDDGRDGGDGDGGDLKATFKDIQRTMGGRLAGAGKRAEQTARTNRSPEDMVKDQMQGVLSDRYSHISREVRADIINTALNLDDIYVLNIEVLTTALVWKRESKKLTAANFAAFCKNLPFIRPDSNDGKKASGPTVSDLLRYIRMLDV
jgi:hypothetical protein